MLALLYPLVHFILPVKVSFEEVLGEPDGVKSIDCVWRYSYLCFTGALNCCYKFLTCLCGVPLALCWGCEFACLAFYHIWYYTPMLRKLSIHLINVRKFMTLVLGVCLGPCCETCGLLFSKIVVKNES